MKKHAISVLLALCLSLGFLPATAWGVDLPKLATPTELAWGKFNDENIPGTCAWTANGKHQYNFRICIYRDGDAAPILTNEHDFSGGTEEKTQFADTKFIIEGIDSGTYYFTVQALGDGVQYADSEIARSECWTYQKALGSNKLKAPTAPVWNADGKFEGSFTLPDDITNAFGYEIHYFFSETTSAEPEKAGGQIRYRLLGATDFIPYEHLIKQHGTGYYSFKVRLLSKDITSVQNSDWSELSPAYYLTTTDMKDALGAITATGADEIRTEVQKLNTEELKTSLLADPAVAEKLEELEKKVGAVTVDVSAAPAAMPMQGARIVGALLNDVTGNVTLKVSKPSKEDLAVPETLKNNTLNLKFSMELEGVQNPEHLKVPVQVTLPIPENVNPDFLYVVHYHSGNSYDILGSGDLFISADRKFVSFVLTSFSDFALVEFQNVSSSSALAYSEVIAPQYQDARQFSEGLAAVKKDGKWGYIDTEGNTVIPFRFDDAGSFNDGYAVVCTQVEENSYQNDDTWYDCYRYGFIKTDGTLTYFNKSEDDNDEYGAVLYGVKRGTALPEIGQFYGDYAAQSYSWEGDWGAALFGKDGKVIELERVEGEDPAGKYYYAGEWPVTDGTTILTEWMPSDWQHQKYYDFETKTTFEPIYDIPEGVEHPFLILHPFDQGLAPVGVPQEAWIPQWGFIDKQGDWVIEPQFMNYIARGTGHQVFFEVGESTLAVVSKWVEASGEKYGAIDKAGNTVIDFKYSELLPFTQGVAAASSKGGMGYINTEEKFIIEPKFRHAGPFGDLGVAIVTDGEEEPEISCYLIDTKGDKIEGSENLDLSKYWGKYGVDSDRGFQTEIMGAPDEYIIIRDRGEGRPSDEYYGVTVYDNPKFGFGRITSGTPLTKSMFTVTGGDNLIYDGKAKTLTITSETLTEGTDYTVTYVGNTDAGTARAMIHGKGEYGGKVEFPFTIQPAPASISAAKVVDKTYNGKTDGKVTSVTFDGLPEGESLTIEKDYTATAVFADAEIGNDKAVTVTVTLRNKNYTLAESTFQTTANIKKRSSGYIPTGGSGGTSEEKPPVETPPTQTPSAETPPAQTPSAEEPVPVPSFTDIAPNAWYYDAVAYVCQKGLMNGTKKDVQFSPEATMTRAMVMTVLARMDGVDTDGGGTWYAKAQSWAVGKGVSSGERPEEDITREQLVTMLWRYTGQPEAAGDLAGFVDGGSVSAYARTAVQWAVEAGLVNGYKDGSFRPRGNAARAEVAAILMRYCESLEK